MVIHDVLQNTPAWDVLHIGRPTASDFAKIITPVGWALSKQATTFAYFKVAEAVLNESFNTISKLEWVDRGKALEPEAVDQYQFINDVSTQKVGFVTTDDGRFGCSPDRFVIRERRYFAPPDGIEMVDVTLLGGLEVKCPAPQTHIAYWAEGPPDIYLPQIFGQMWICELEWVDFFSYYPRMPPVQHRIRRDPRRMAQMIRALRQFDDLLASLQAKIRAEGFFDQRPEPVTPVDKLMEDMSHAAGLPLYDDGC